MARHTNYAVKFHTKTAQAAAAIYIPGITDLGLNNELQTLVEGGDGSVYNTFGSLVAGAPVGRFTSSDLKAFLDECGLEGMLVDSDGSHPGIDLYYQSYAQGGTRGGAGTHHQTTVANGIVVPRSISMTHQQTATLTAEVIARQEAATAPLAFDEAASLPAAVYPAVTSAWTLGAVKFNSTAITGLQSVNIDFGIQLLVDARDSDIYPSIVAIQKIQPVITIVAADIDVTATLTEDGVNYATDLVDIYAKKKAEGATFVADGTAEHIKFTLGKCRVDWTEIGGDDPKTISMRLTPWYTDGATPKSPLAINTASAIT